MECAFKPNYMSNIPKAYELPHPTSCDLYWASLNWSAMEPTQYVTYSNNGIEWCEDRNMFIDSIHKKGPIFLFQFRSFETNSLKILRSMWVRVWYKNKVSLLYQRVLYEIEEQCVRSMVSCRRPQTLRKAGMATTCIKNYHF